MFGLSKLADKDFVIGFVLPVLIAGTALIGLFYDSAPLTSVVAKLSKDNSFANLEQFEVALNRLT